MSEQGLRYNKGKPRYSLESPFAREGLVKVFTRGAIKYTVYGECTCSGLVEDQHSLTCDSRKVIRSGDWNWAKGLSWAETIDSLERHIIEFKKGVLLDPDTGLPHIDHIQWNAHVLSHFQKTNTGTDDRYKHSVEHQKESAEHELGELADRFGVEAVKRAAQSPALKKRFEKRSEPAGMLQCKGGCSKMFHCSELSSGGFCPACFDANSVVATYTADITSAHVMKLRPGIKKFSGVLRGKK